MHHSGMSTIIISGDGSAVNFFCNLDMQVLLPYGEGICPLHISEEEELERLAGLQLRDSLVRGLGVGEHLQVSLDQMTTPSATRPPSSMCPCTNATNYYYDSDDRPAMQHQQAAAPSAFFTHVVYRDHIDPDINASQSGSSLPNETENTVITSVTNSTDSTPLHSLPGAGQGAESGPGRPPERGSPRIHSDSHHLFHYHHHHHHDAGAAKRSHSYSLGAGVSGSSLGGSGSPAAQYATASTNSLSAAYHRPTYAFGSTIK